MLPQQHRTLLKYLHASIHNVAEIQIGKTGNFLVFVGDKSGPIEVAFWHSPAEAGRILKVLAVLAGIDEKLLCDAPADNTGPVKLMFLRDGNPFAVQCG